MKKLFSKRWPHGAINKAAAVGIILALMMTGCAKSTNLTMNAGGHEIRAVVAGNHSCSTQTDQAVIVSKFGKIIVERARARIDDGPWATIPDGVPVAVRITRRAISLTAGPVTVSRTRGLFGTIE